MILQPSLGAGLLIAATAVGLPAQQPSGATGAEQQTGAPWVRDRLVPGTWTYRALARGTEVGEATRVVERSVEEGRAVFRLRSSFRASDELAPVSSEHDTLVVDLTTLAPLRVRQHIDLLGEDVSVSLDYQGGRVRGRVREPGREGLEEVVPVDSTLAEGAIEETQVELLVHTLPLASGAQWAFTASSGWARAMRRILVRVTGTVAVAVPGGSFPCWRVEVTGGEEPAAYYITKSAPYTVVRYEFPRTRAVFELVRRAP